MDKLKFETPDMVSGNIDKIAVLFPSAITEMRGEDGEIRRGVNFEVLKQLLSREVVDGNECYEFTWVAKSGHGRGGTAHHQDPAPCEGGQP